VRQSDDRTAPLKGVWIDVRDRADDVVLVIRYGSHINLDVIDAHREVLSQKGKVLFGKIGKSLGRSRIALLNDKIKRLGHVKIFLVGARSISAARPVFEAQVIGVGSMVKEELKGRYAPPYYKAYHIDRTAKCWFMITSIKKRKPFGEGELVTRGGGDLAYALDHSMAGLFVAHPPKSK
jgi:hypothetical protein